LEKNNLYVFYRTSLSRIIAIIGAQDARHRTRAAYHAAATSLHQATHISSRASAPRSLAQVFGIRSAVSARLLRATQ
jgi:hypothetical protein